MEMFSDAYQEAMSYFPRSSDFKLGPEQYLEQIRKIKRAVDIPVIASLNGTTRTGWLEYASLIQQAGADAVELNVYHVVTDQHETSDLVEKRVLDITTAVKQAVSIPVAIKLSAYFSSLPNLVLQLEERGANGFVLFNRFYQPDIDLETMEVVPRLRFSEPTELLLRLRWLAILSGQGRASLAVSGGVHTATDAIKALLAGACAVQMVSALLKHGPEHLRTVREDMERWMQDNEYESISQMRGAMSLSRCPDPRAFERGNYMRILQSWRGESVSML